MIKKMFSKLSAQTAGGQRGDTIVEVLVCLAVLGVVLGGAYVTANRNTLINQSSQERLAAVKLAETQIERLRVATASNPAVLNMASAFCLPPTSPATAVGAGSTLCQMTAAEAPAPAGSTPRYAVRVQRETVATVASLTSRRYKVTVEWDNISGSGSGRDKVDTYYEVYQ